MVLYTWWCIVYQCGSEYESVIGFCEHDNKGQYRCHQLVTPHKEKITNTLHVGETAGDYFSANGGKG
jgi:hypothetical protein